MLQIWAGHLHCLLNQTQSCWRTIWQHWKVGGCVAESCFWSVWMRSCLLCVSYNREFAPVQSSNAFRSSSNFRVAHQRALPSSPRSGEKTLYALTRLTVVEIVCSLVSPKDYILLLSTEISFSFLATAHSGNKALCVEFLAAAKKPSNI